MISLSSATCFLSISLPPSAALYWFPGWPSPVTSLGQQPRGPSEPSSDPSLHVCQEPVCWALSGPPGWNFVTGCVCMCVLVVWEGVFHRVLRQSQLLCGGPRSHPSPNSDSYCSWPKLQTSAPVFLCAQGIWVNRQCVVTQRSHCSLRWTRTTLSLLTCDKEAGLGRPQLGCSVCLELCSLNTFFPDPQGTSPRFVPSCYGWGN